MQELIDFLEPELKMHDFLQLPAYEKARSLIEKEKEQITNAFNQGFREGESETMVADTKKDVSEYDDAVNYYKSTFGDKVEEAGN